MQDISKRLFEVWKVNPNHPSLDFKEVDPARDWWQVRAGKNYRAICTKKEDHYYWWIIDTKPNIKALLSGKRKKQE